MLADYLLRAAVTSTTSLFRPPASLLEDVHLPFHPWPFDLDWNGHVNNGRYLTLMDHGRLDHGMRTGVLPLLFRGRCNPVVAGASIQFYREVRPFVRCTLVTRIRGWDERRVHYSQRIEVGGRVYAKAKVQIALRSRGRTVSPIELFVAAGREAPQEFVEARLATSAEP